jgi:NTP pyrophosphatase (non-canonical NTP hydrolase)
MFTVFTCLVPQRLGSVAAEMADVLIYLCRLADVLGVDLLTAAEAKLAVNEGRFPVGE